MKVIVLGASGLIGHKLFEKLSNRFDTYGTLRSKIKNYKNDFFISYDNFIDQVNAHDFNTLTTNLEKINPDVILNCIGITKRKVEINLPLESIYINSIFPHKLLRWANNNNKRLIHFSTDCVFNGSAGNYSEQSLTDSKDNYGRTKALGEISCKNGLTIRSSFIGRELLTNSELLEWFLSEKNASVKGFKNALYSGVSTNFLAKVVGDIIEFFPKLHGIRQLSIKNPISKYDLLNIAKVKFNKSIDIIPDEKFKTNASLNGDLLRSEISYGNPNWNNMMEELATDYKFYKSY